MLKWPRLVQYDILNLPGTHSMKTPPEQGCGDGSRHAPQGCGTGRRAHRSSAAHAGAAATWEWLRESGARGVWEDSLEGTGFPAAVPGAGLHPCRGRAGSGTGQDAAALPKARARLSKQLHEAMVNTLHRAAGAPGDLLLPRVPCRGGMPCQAPLPAKAGGAEPIGGGRRVWQQLSTHAGVCGGPPCNAGEGGECRAHLCIPMGQEACEERGSSTRVHAGGSPQP